jgi:hypothetical protein
MIVEGVDYAARDRVQAVLNEALSYNRGTPQSGNSSSPLCFKSLLAATVFIMVVSGVTSLAVVSTYCAFMGHAGM